MRGSSYSRPEEEPYYYEEYVEFIFKISWLKDKIERGIAEDKDKKDFIKEKIKESFLECDIIRECYRYYRCA